MPWLTQLADVARRTGFPVEEVSGWRTRGREAQAAVDGIVCHHTATPKSVKGDYPTLRVVRDGHGSLPGPLSHFGLGRGGTIYVIAAGRCNHNAPSTSPQHTNSRSIGIEAENSGRSDDPWSDVQKRAYVALVAELAREFDLPVSRIKGHKEVNTAKNDPTFNMATFRQEVTDYRPGQGQEDNDMPRHRRFEKDRAQTLPPGEWTSLEFETVVDADHGGTSTGSLYSLVGVNEKGGALYDFSVGVTIAGLEPGAEVQLRATEYEPDGKGGWEYARNRPIDSPVHAGGNGHFTYAWKGNLAKGRRVRVRVVQYGDTPASITSATSDVFYWPK